MDIQKESNRAIKKIKIALHFNIAWIVNNYVSNMYNHVQYLHDTDTRDLTEHYTNNLVITAYEV